MRPAFEPNERSADQSTPSTAASVRRWAGSATRCLLDLRPDQDVVGTIATADGTLDIIVERVDRGKLGKVWLFSGKTLASIPAVFHELSTPALEQLLPEFLVRTRIASIPLFEWLALFVGMPLLFMSTGLVNRLLAWIVGTLRRRLGYKASDKNPQILRVPLRLLLVALVIHLLLPSLAEPLGD